MTGFAAIPVEGGNVHQKFKGTSRILGPTWLNLPALTIGLLGVQIFWSVEMSYASPYLLSIGLSKSSMAIVFLAGPLSGLIMQPLIGVLADNCTSRFGRRRPYMLLGTVVCIFAMLLLGFTRPVASIFTGWNNDVNDIVTMWLAVLAIYLIDFSINAVQAVDRALLVDTLPSAEQPAGNAWAARMLGVGSVIGFFVGNIDLPSRLPFLGKSQLEVLSIIVSLLLFAGHAVMVVVVKERILLKDNGSKMRRKTFTQELKDMWFSMRTLPPVIRQIFIIQFFASLGWFPILFYSTIYVGDLYKSAVLAASASPLSDQGRAALDAEATRFGSRALFYSSLVSLFCITVLPYFVSEAADEGASSRQRNPDATRLSSDVADGSDTYSHLVRNPARWRVLFKRLVSLRVPRKLQVHLGSLWTLSHLVVAGCMFGTFLTSSVYGATLLITVTGFSWAIATWAPFSLLGEAILTEHTPTDVVAAIRLTDTRTRNSADDERETFLPKFGSGVANGDNDDLDECERSEVSILSVDQANQYRVDSNLDSGNRNFENESEQNGGLSSKAGVIIGINNIFVVIPQFLVTGISAIIFAIFDPNKSVLHGSPHGAGGAVGAPINGTTAGAGMLTHTLLRRSEDNVSTSNSVVYIFRLGGIAATVAWILCWRLTRDLKHRGL